QLSYGPICLGIPPVAGPPRPVLCSAASHAAQGPNFGASALVATDVEVEVLVLFLVFLEEGVFVVLADVLDVFDVLDIGNLLAAGCLAGLCGVGVFQRDDLGLAGRGGRHFLDLDFLFGLLLLFTLGDLARRRGALLEIGARVGFARIRRDDRILVEVVEL